MWAFLVLSLALAGSVSGSNNDTAAEEEKLVIARGKLLVSTFRNTPDMDNIEISSGCLVIGAEAEMK